MASHMSALTRSTRAASTIAATVEQMTGTYTARISSVRNGMVYVVLPTYDLEREFGPCIVPVGIQGVGPITATYHNGPDTTASSKGSLGLGGSAATGSNVAHSAGAVGFSGSSRPEVPTVTATVANAIPLVKGLLVLVQFPESGHPWLLAIAPTGT